MNVCGVSSVKIYKKKNNFNYWDWNKWFRLSEHIHLRVGHLEKKPLRTETQGSTSWPIKFVFPISIEQIKNNLRIFPKTASPQTAGQSSLVACLCGGSLPVGLATATFAFRSFWCKNTSRMPFPTHQLQSYVQSDFNRLHQTKTKVFTAGQSRQNTRTKWTNQNRKQNHTTRAKRGKRRRCCFVGQSGLKAFRTFPALATGWTFSLTKLQYAKIKLLYQLGRIEWYNR